MPIGTLAPGGPPQGGDEGRQRSNASRSRRRTGNGCAWICVKPAPTSQ